MKKSPLFAVAAAAVTVALTGPATAREVPPSVAVDQVQALEQIEIESGFPVRAAFDEAHGTVRWLSGRLGALAAPLPESAMSWLVEHGRLLRLDCPRAQLRFAREIRSNATGYGHLVFARQEAGTLVWGAEVVLHVSSEGMLTDVTAGYPPALPVVAGALRLQDALDAAAGEMQALSPELAPRRPVRRVLVEHDGALVAAWQASLMWHDEAPRAFDVLVSAVDGRVLRRFTLIQHGLVPEKGSGKLPGGQDVDLNIGFNQDGKHYVLHDLVRKLSSGKKFVTYDAKNQGNIGMLLGLYEEVVSSGTQFKDSAAVAGHHNMGLVYDYFQKTHEWQSWNGQGGSIETYVHVDDQLNNAYWHGGVEAMFFGDGDGAVFTQLATCLDVAGHELTHGVVDGTVELVYENEPGALNEHIADFFGTMIDRPNGSSSDWWLGEQCMGPEYPTPYLRHIKDPSKGGQPGHAFDFVELPNTEDGDWGGVHINSGVPNKVSYLITQSLGPDKTEAIHFELLRGKYLGKQATFLDFRNGWISACKAVASAVDCDNGQGAFDQAGILAQGAKPDCPAGASAGGKFGCRCPSNSPFNYSTGKCGGSAGDSCGGVPAAGTCEGATLKICVNGKVVTTPCGGGACTWSPVYGSYQCGKKLDCSDVGPEGTCSGSQVLHCDGGTLEVLDCAQYGKTCSGAKCVDSGTSGCSPSCAGKACGGDGCGGTCGSCPGGDVCELGTCAPWQAKECGQVTYEGECSGDRLAYCDQDILVELDCAATGGTCGYDDENQYFDCILPEGAEDCGAVTGEGECAGSVLRYCDGSKLVVFDCAAMGLLCGYNQSAAYYDCLGAEQEGCGDITWEGTCTSDNAVKWCEKEKIQVLQCATEYQKCQYTLAGFFYDCVNFAEPPPGEQAPSREGGLCAASPRPATPPLAVLGLLLLVLGALLAWRLPGRCLPGGKTPRSPRSGRLGD